MRFSLLKALCMIVLAVCAANAQGPSAAGRRQAGTSVPLHAGWKFREAGKDAWHAAAVPGCVHTDLLKNGLIEDPFYRDNEKKLQWIGKTDWEYETTFRVGADTLARGHVELVFEGLDTYASVTLNGVSLLAADNMFRVWRVDAKRALGLAQQASRWCPLSHQRIAAADEGGRYSCCLQRQGERPPSRASALPITLFWGRAS